MIGKILIKIKYRQNHSIVLRCKTYGIANTELDRK